MEKSSNSIHIAILVADGFERLELACPHNSLTQAGADVHVISANKDEVKSWHQVDWGDAYKVDVPLTMARPDYYQALLIPGGLMSLTELRVDQHALDFVKHFVEQEKPIGAIGTGQQLLISANACPGRRMTSARSLQIDLENAGATWIDQSVVTDKGLVTCRGTDDLPAFMEELLKSVNLPQIAEVQVENECLQ
ncbi:DJ-1/PfpI family protein [Dyadobacter tibetensis]|uniref:DJ-1/PfpI family protein n=1 Tax=Dyadobacter tibetensis TaxID=1211851 RepID=UPI0004729945|nr:DJ-1/PfpI family protein [Dyadobacter tibetensis]